ncbi:MAG TPA: beta-galactosidase [Phycisphaerales bacterium]|nr:beta-galactosidase [Phycisphaerales bacterium]HMP37539.1 beta-galactosidase [Phycisphaerales bacterium]
MPSVSYDGQSFLLNGRRLWLCGASIPYALIPPSEWKRTIAAAAEAGFNAVETSVPWMLHEPRPGRFEFSGGLDVAAFVRMCGEAGLRVLLRVGPSIGGTLDGGGLPAWLAEIPGLVVRQGNEAFLERVSAFFHRLFEGLVELQATRPGVAGREGGPLLLVQVEHAWHCANEEEGRRYLGELVRYVRECGVSVPLLSANDLWQDVEGTIETWTGSTDLLVNLRQLRAVQSHAPRLVTSFDPSGFECWGAPPPAPIDRDRVFAALGQILAAGAQPFVVPFHPGVNRGFLGGRLAGGPDRYACTRAAADPPLDEAGRRGPKYLAIKRLAGFATSFGHVFAELDPDYHPIALDVESVIGGRADSAAGKGRARPGAARSDAADAAQVAVVPLEGPQGRMVFVFSGSSGPRRMTLLLENGVRMPIALGDQTVGWYVFDVDLLGNGRLDFCNLCPAGLIDRSILVLQGPAKVAAYLSINGGPLEAIVPEGRGAPLAVAHKGVAVVICNQEQIDATYHDHEAVYVGCEGFDDEGRPILAAGFAKVWRVGKDGACKVAPHSVPHRAHGAISLAGWKRASSRRFATGESARFATLAGPASLCECGASVGYGWYRVRFKAGAAKKRSLIPVGGGDRLHLFVGGKLERIVGTGPGAAAAPFDLRAGGDVTLAFLADNMGRFAEGSDAGERKGLPGSLLEITPLKGVRSRRVEAPPADPFKLRGFIAGHAVGQLGSATQMQWTFNHRRKTLLAILIRGLRQGGTLLLNNQPLAYYAGAGGGMSATVILDPATAKGYRQGANLLRFSPDPVEEGPAEDPLKSITIHEVLRDLGQEAHWSFARWSTPPEREFSSEGKPSKGLPAWWRTSFEIKEAAPLWLSLGGLTKGVVLLNGQPIGRYFVATHAGRPVGPPTSVYLAAADLRTDGPNDLVIFDEHGAAPNGVRLSGTRK